MKGGGHISPAGKNGVTCKNKGALTMLLFLLLITCLDFKKDSCILNYVH